MLRAAPTTLPNTNKLLIAGGDGRITPDPRTGVNRYGCRATPDPDLLSFSSATASVISTGAYAAADRLRDSLQAALHKESAETVYARQLQALRDSLLELCELRDLPAPEVIFAASGTDLHHIATQLSLAANRSGLTVLMVDEEETGSGVFASISYAAPDIAIHTIALRDAQGAVRPAALVDEEYTRLALEAHALGRQVLLIQTDVSKTGLIAPSYACTANLSDSLGTALDVLVDACQFRISTATLRACLQRGYNVALTGSKFVGGPSFSGALLIPVPSAARIRQRYLDATPALPANSAVDIWQASYIDEDSWGMLLRWEAALHELRAFRRIPEAAVTDFLRRCAEAISFSLSHDRTYAPVTTPALQRSALHQERTWDEIPSIHTFRLHGPDGLLLDAAQISTLYRSLPHATTRCQLAQPVACGTGKDALRLCLSAHHIVTACRGETEAAQVIAQAQQVLDQVARLSRPASARIIAHDLIRRDTPATPHKRWAQG